MPEPWHRYLDAVSDSCVIGFSSIARLSASPALANCQDV
jgi:hypothetical protein